MVSIIPRISLKNLVTYNFQNYICWHIRLRPTEGLADVKVDGISFGTTSKDNKNYSTFVPYLYNYIVNSWDELVIKVF